MRDGLGVLLHCFLMFVMMDLHDGCVLLESRNDLDSIISGGQGIGFLKATVKHLSKQLINKRVTSNGIVHESAVREASPSR